jgi:peptidoglycan hydrolase CwlO-like protein
MSTRFKRIVVILIVVGLLMTGIASVFGQSNSDQAEKAQLETKLKEIEAAILKGERDLTLTQAEKERYQYEISTIKKRIDQLGSQIRQAEATVKVLTGQIKDTESSIGVSLSKIKDLREKLTNNLRVINEEDNKSAVEIILTEDNISEYFDNSSRLKILTNESRDLLGKIVTLKINLEEEKEVLDSKKSETEQMARIQALQAEESRRIQQAQEALLRETQSKEAAQKQELTALEKEAAEIRARIIQLAGTPADVPMPSLGEAIDIAKWVEKQTGVKPAFLVAIILQESALGRNVGQCYITDSTSGNSRNLAGRLFPRGIHPTRDLPLFLQITKELNRDPMKTPISCWADVGMGPNYGWGGAMGPAQFIPSTWQGYRNELTLKLGAAADPWKIRDSFLAAGLLLRDNGAAYNELTAAARYFGSAGLGYESSVMRRRSCLQIFIDQSTMTAECSRLIFVP